MASNRYDGREIFHNAHPMYRKKFMDRRGAPIVKQYTSPTFTYPDVADMADLTLQPHVWKMGDRLYKLSYTYYETAEMGWVIALFNQRPTESHCKLGDVLYIPRPLETVMNYLGI